MPVNAVNLKYGKAAADRILGLKAHKVKDVRVDDVVYGPKVVWVCVKGHSPRFMARKSFDHHFEQWRQEQAMSLSVHANGDQGWLVINPAKSSSYLVEGRRDGLFCTCDDFNNQLQHFGSGCCKHGYAVLQQLGHSSLETYLAA